MNCVICKIGMRRLTEDLSICDTCGLISSDINPDTSIYDKSYTIKYSRYERTTVGKRIQELRYQVVNRHVEQGSVLDFGCGVGSFVKKVGVDANYSCYGFDINPYSGYSDIAVLFEDYKVVTFWDSIEHLRDPKKIIKGLDAEYVFICTPSTDDFDGRDFTAWRHYMPHEHCHYFNSKSLSALLSVCGYSEIEANYAESKERNSGGICNIITIGGVRG